MERKLKQLIASESKRKPLTDQKLAEALSIRREEVTLLRKEFGIPVSRLRRQKQLVEDASGIIAKCPDISVRKLTAKLQSLGYEISRYVVGQLLGELEEEGGLPKKLQVGETTAFVNLIGWDGSLRTQIQQAKAAVIYPPSGLHTIILGESGVGKSELAEAMYRYSLEAGPRQSNPPFVSFNCADYAENPQLLISQLFGHAKGAYTGATDNKAGLVEKADGGLLFLDEVHRLPPEGQEILYSIIDRGKYRKLGETDSQRQVDLMIIAATTEELESSLLIPFRRRIPMVIELPPLRSRPPQERLEIILHFFRLESSRLSKKLIVSRDVIKALLSGEKPGNVGQIRSDVQVACARGFLNHFSNTASEEITITLNDLSTNARRALLSDTNRQTLEELAPKDKVFYSDGCEQKTHILQDNIYAMPDEIYTRIEELVKEGRRQGFSPEETSHWVSQQIEQELGNIIKRIENISPALSRHDLEKLMGPGLSSVVYEMVDIAGMELDLDEEQLFFCLIIHLNTALDRIKSGKPITNPQLNQIKRNHEQEYVLAVKMAAVIKRRLGLTLPEEEVGFIALYLRTFLSSNQVEEGRVAVLILSHGRVAQEMVNVVHALLRVNHAHSLDMALIESPEHFLERVILKAKEIDQGKGILLLVDMGSLITFGEIITKELGIPVRVIDRVDMVMALEATRWSMLPGVRLNEIASDLAASKTASFSRQGKAKQMIVSLCLSGIGGAEKIRSYLVSQLMDTEVEIRSIGMIDESRLKRKIAEWQKTHNLVAIIGTINPDIPHIPFISYDIVMGISGMKYLRSLLMQTAASSFSGESIIRKEVVIAKSLWKKKEIIIRSLGKLLLEQGFVTPGYIESVFEREEFAPTCLEGGIAIPHGDPAFVVKPGIAVATLEQPIEWWGLEVDVVFLMALRVSDRKTFANLLRVFKDNRTMKAIRSSQSAEAIAAVIEEEVTNVV